MFTTWRCFISIFLPNVTCSVRQTLRLTFFSPRRGCTRHSVLLKQCVHRKPEEDASSHCTDVQSSFLVHFNLCALLLVAKDVNILFDELEAVNSPCKDDDSLLHPGNLTSASEDTSRLEAGGEVRACMTSWECDASGGILCSILQTIQNQIPSNCRLPGSTGRGHRSVQLSGSSTFRGSKMDRCSKLKSESCTCCLTSRDV